MSFGWGERRQDKAAGEARVDGTNHGARIIPLRQLHEASSVAGEPAPSPSAPAHQAAATRPAESELRGEAKTPPLPGRTITIEQPIPAAVPSDGEAATAEAPKVVAGVAVRRRCTSDPATANSATCWARASPTRAATW
jgi:hypothetical protein